jgi:hypothetical protein
MDDFDLFNLVEPEARKAGVSTDLILRQIRQESKGNPHAVSVKGAQGLMQLMPATALSYGVTDPFDPVQNVKAGISHMGKLLKRYKGDQRQALLDYNGGPAAVQAFQSGHPFKESQGYLAAIEGQQGQPQQAPQTGAPPPAPAPDDFGAFNQLAQAGEHPENFDQTAAKAAQGATRLTPGYGGTVEFLRALPATAGSFAGNVSKATGPVGAVIGSALSAAGAATGEALTMGAEKGASMLGLTNVPPPTWEGAKSRLEEAATAGAGGELLGRGAGWVANKVMAPFASKVDAEGLRVRQMFPNALPNQVADSHVLDTATAIAEHAPLTGGRVAASRKAMANEAQQKAMAILQKHGGTLTPENAGQVFQDALAGETQAFHTEGSKLYQAVDQAAQGVKVPLDSLSEYAQQELQKRAGVPGEVSGNRGLKMLKQVAAAGKGEGDDAAAQQLAEIEAFTDDPATRDILRKQMGVTDEAPMAKEMTFQQAASYRSDLNSFIRRATAEKDDVARGVAQQLLKRLDAAMDTAGAATGVSDLYRQANTFYKAGKQTYESDLMRTLADQYPSKVAERLQSINAPEAYRAARTAVTPQGWKGVQSSVAQDIIAKATSENGEVLQGSQLLGKLREIGKPSLKEIFPADHAEDLWTLGTVLDRAQRSTGNKGRIGIYLGQSGVVASALALHMPEASAGILVTPYLLGRLMTNPKGAKWLSVGLTAPRGSKLAAQAATKLLAQLAVDRDQQEGPPPSPQVGAPPPAP